MSIPPCRPRARASSSPIAKANPGRLNFGSSGTGAVNHLSQALFAQRAGIEVVHVPYRGGAPGLLDLRTGRIQAMFAAVQEALPAVREGATRALAVSSAERSPLLPEVPPVADTLPGFDVVFWQGLFAPAGTPEAVVARLGAALARGHGGCGAPRPDGGAGRVGADGRRRHPPHAARAGNRELGPADPGGRHQARVRAPSRPCRVPRGRRIIGAISAAAAAKRPATGRVPSMLGLMQDRPLLISAILEHAARNHPAAKIVSARADGSLARHTWPQIAARAAQLAHALAARGVGRGERIATLAWNDHRHLEAYYGISCMGAVLHTVNPRLFPDQIAFILADAEDTHLLVDPTLLPVLEGLADRLPPSLARRGGDGRGGADPGRVQARRAGGDAGAGGADRGPAGALRLAGPRRARRLLALLHLGHHGRAEGRALQPPLHRAARASPPCRRTCFNIGATDVVMPVVPMFHVNAWGIPYSAGMAGASLVLPGPKLDPASLHRLFEEERVTFSAGVPTIWTALLQWLRADPSRRFANPPRLVVGGTALPQAINAGFLKEYGVHILHAWGMTETSPLGATNARKPENADWDGDRFLDYARKQGRPLFGVELRVRDAAGEPIAA